ncbi:unnamed protein product, partial [marine sediment metagenome]
SAVEGDLNAEVDPRFGRAAYFLIVDTDTMAVKAIRNPHVEALLGAGIQSAELVAREGAEVVLTGECGVHAFDALSRLNVKVVTGVKGRVVDAVRAFLKENPSFASGPNIACPPTCSAADCSACQAASIGAKAVATPEQEDLERLIRRITDEVLKRLGHTSERTAPEVEIEEQITVPSKKKLHPGLTLAVASGKGGTGKTTVAVNLALSLKEPVNFLDCDVEEPNAHIFLLPRYTDTMEVQVSVPVFDLNRCDYCGQCADLCRFNALAVAKGKLVFFEELCRSCGGCFLVCPRDAISEGERAIGHILVGETGELRFYGGELHIGEQVVGPILRRLKNYQDVKKINVLDCAPGVGPAVLASVWDADFCLLVTEPTPFGLNDLKLSAKALEMLGVPFGVLINRDGIGDDEVERFCASNDIPVLLKIPHDPEIAKGYAQGIPLVRQETKWIRTFEHLWETIQ